MSLPAPAYLLASCLRPALTFSESNRTIKAFFAPSEFHARVFDNRQDFDYAGLEGRLLSSSYTPRAGDPKHEPMLRELRRIFDSNQVNGRIIFEYDTRVYYGQMN